MVHDPPSDPEIATARELVHYRGAILCHFSRPGAKGQRPKAYIPLCAREKSRLALELCAHPAGEIKGQRGSKADLGDEAQGSSLSLSRGRDQFF